MVKETLFDIVLPAPEWSGLLLDLSAPGRHSKAPGGFGEEFAFHFAVGGADEAGFEIAVLAVDGVAADEGEFDVVAQVVGEACVEFDGYLERRVGLYQYADHLATKHQKFRNRSAVTLFIAAALAVSLAALQIIVLPVQLWPIAAEIGLMLFAAVSLHVSRREAWHEKWLYDRHLAERLRGLLFYEIAQAASHADAARRPILPFYGLRGAWVENLVRSETEAASPPALDNVLLRT